ncbi:unnamed protein product [Dicrocoelium dendriticum]|nr:unnamed protein product [Dicrocoelium dendriticum]
MTSLQSPDYIRQRICQLTATEKQLKEVICPKPQTVDIPDVQSPILVDRSVQSGSRTYFTFDGINGQIDHGSRDSPRSPVLANGLMDASSAHLDFADIPVKPKRSKTMSCLSAGGIPAPSKRLRLDSAGSCTQVHDLVLLPKVESPFLNAEMRRHLESEFRCNNISASFRKRRQEHSSNASRPPSRPDCTSALVCGGHVQPALSLESSSSIRLESLLEANNRRCQQLVDFSDWCSESILNILNLSSSCSIHDCNSGLSINGCYTVHSLCPDPLRNVASSCLSILPCSRLLCSRSPALAFTPLFVTRCLRHFPCPIPACSHDFEYGAQSSSTSHCPFVCQLSNVVRALYAFTEQARWLSVNNTCFFNRSPYSPEILFTPLSRLFHESGKFFTLNNLLEGFLGARVSKHPRCIFLLAHRISFLTLLDAYLSASSWSSLRRIILPHDYRAVGPESCSSVDEINNWPRGSKGTLFALIHSRSPVSYISGLRAGSDTVVILCDVDWRSDSLDQLRSLLHSWALNGLAASQARGKTDMVTPIIRVYRLVSVGEPGRAILCSSVEASISSGVACRLLPESVFQAHACDSMDRNALFIARVQPNVVNEFLNSRTAWDHRSMSWVTSCKHLGLDRDSILAIKQEAMSCSSPSSVMSSMSYPAADGRRDETPREGEFITFQEREPLSENLFFRALELFEDPDDTQAWCCANAEQVAVAATIFDELIDVDCSDDLDSETEDSVEFIQPSDLFLRDHLLETEEENQLSAPILQELLAYSNEVSWEVACQEAMDSVNQLEIFGTHHGSMLSYNSSASFCLTPRDTSTLPPMDLEFFGYDMCLPHFSDLPIWNPLDALEPTIQAGGNVEPTSTKVHPAVPMVDKDLHTQFSIWKSASDPANGISHLSFGDPDWGYEFEPMPEHELPPITHAPTTHVSSAQIVPHTNGRSSKWTESSLCSMHKSGRRIHLTTSLSSGSRGSFSGPYLKRRRLAGTTGVSARGTTTSSMTTPTITTNVFTITSQPDSQLTTSPSSAASSKASVSDTYLPSSLVCSTQPSTINLPTTGASSVVSTAGGHSSGSGNTVMLTLTTVGNVSTGGSKLHIPKVSYNKEISSSRTNRLRRSNVPTTVGTVASVTPTVGPIAAGVHLLPPQLSKTTSTYSGHTSQLHAGNVSSFPNPIILARYGHTSPGRHHATQVTQRTAVGSPNATAAAGASGMISLVLTPPSPCGMNNTASSGHLHVGKPLEWFPHEEAALYQSILKLQDTNFDAMGPGASNSALSPNFRLAEFFINNFFPVRGFRGARQCLLMHSKMLGIINTAISSLPTGACSFLQANGFIPPENLSTPSTASPTSNSSTHGSTGRKVKSKLKTSASCINLGATAQASGSVGTTALHSKDSSVDSVAAVNRYRSYLAFQYLQSAISSAVASNASSINTAAFESFSSFPPYLAQFLNVVRANDNNQSRFLRKAIKECLFSPPVVHPTQHHRSMTSRRQPPGGFAGPQNTSASALTGYHVGGGMQLNFTSPSGSGLFTFPLNPGQSSSPGPYAASAIGHSVHSSTAPALLTHHRHHRHLGYDHPPGTQAGVSTIESTSSGQLPSAGTSSGSYGGPMIQKNPTHVAALQEHNINPDTLITPAMVIKNKEEREARLLTDASSYEPQTVTTTSTVPGSPNFVTVGYVPTSIFPSAAISLQPTSLGTHQHSADLTSPTVFLSSTSDNVSGSGAASSVSAPLNLTGGHLSISHTGHRGASFVTIVSSNPTMLRRSATFTPISLSSQPILSYTDGASTGGSIISKPSTGTGYFIQQRSQFISANQTLSTSSARGIFTTVATVSLAPSGLPLSSNFGSLAAPLPQILRSRNTLRGAVVQSTIVRTINASTFPSAVTRFTCTNTGLLPGRTTYTVPSISSTVSSVLGSRGGNLTGMRGHPSVFQQIRAVNHPHHHHHHPGTGLGSYSYGGSQLDSDDSRFVPAQLSTPSNSYIAPGSAVSNASTTASFRQSEADPYVQTRFRPHPAP